MVNILCSVFIIISYSSLISPDRIPRPALGEHLSFLPGENTSTPSDQTLVLYVPEVEEIRISPVVARKGYLNVLEQKTNGWKKRWVVCTFNIFLGIIYYHLI